MRFSGGYALKSCNTDKLVDPQSTRTGTTRSLDTKGKLEMVWYMSREFEHIFEIMVKWENQE